MQSCVTSMVIMCKLPRHPSPGALQYNLEGELLWWLVGRVRRTRRTRTCRLFAQTMYRGERNVIRDRSGIGVCDPREIIPYPGRSVLHVNERRAGKGRVAGCDVRRARSSVASAHCLCESRGTWTKFCLNPTRPPVSKKDCLLAHPCQTVCHSLSPG